MSEELRVLRSREEIDELIRYLSNPDLVYVAYDTETTGLALDAQVIGFSVAADTNLGFYVVLAEWRSPGELVWLGNKDSAVEVLRLLLSKSLIMHNAVVDINWTRVNFGVDLMPALHTDTMLLAHLVDENRRVGLKELAYTIFGEGAKTEQEEMKASVIANGGAWEEARGGNREMYKADPDLIGRYGAKDTLLTLRLFYHFLPQLFEEELDKFFYDDETMPLLKCVTYDMNTTGLKLDLPAIRQLQNELETNCALLKEQIEFDIKPYIAERFPKGVGKKRHQFNIGSKQQMAWLLYVRLRNDWKKLTESGRSVAKELCGKVPYNPKERRAFEKALQDAEADLVTLPKIAKYIQCDKNALLNLSHKYTWVARLLKHNQEMKILTTYVRGLQEREYYGVIHPSFLQHGTTSGRYSSRDPNFQNLPRDDTRVKRCIVARPGHVFVGADFCLHPESEVLTPSGWKNIMNIGTTDQVWQVDKDSLLGSFVYPTRIIRREYSGNMHTIGNRRGCIAVTQNHTMLYAGQNHSKRPTVAHRRRVTVSQDAIPTGMGLVPYSVSDTTSQHSSEEIWKACAVQADGSATGMPDTWRIQVSLTRKRLKLAELFGPGRLAGYIRVGHSLETESWRVSFCSSLLTPSKGLDLSSLGANHSDTVVEALSFWDGTRPPGSPRRYKFFSTDESTIDNVQSYLVRSGWEASKQGPDRHGLYALSMRKESRIRLIEKTDHKVQFYSGPVGCVTVPSGFILVRYKGCVAVTGNCQLEARVFAFMSGDETLMASFENGEDFYSIIGMNVFQKFDCTPHKDGPNAFGFKYKALRQIAKNVALAATYGTTAFRLTDMLRDEEGQNIPPKKCQEIIDDFFEAYPKIKAYQRRMHEQVIDCGYVASYFGRKRRIPDARKIRKLLKKGEDGGDLPYEYRTLLNLGVNHSVQSTAASVVNRAAIAFRRRADALGLASPIVLQVHDELVVETPEESAKRVAALLKHCMETTTVFKGMRFTAEPKISKDLAGLK